MFTVSFSHIYQGFQYNPLCNSWCCVLCCHLCHFTLEKEMYPR